MNYTDSDGHTLALMNRGNWEVLEERDDDTEELNVYVFKASTRKERKLATKNALLKEDLVNYVIWRERVPPLRSLLKRSSVWEWQAARLVSLDFGNGFEGEPGHKRNTKESNT